MSKILSPQEILSQQNITKELLTKNGFTSREANKLIQGALRVNKTIASRLQKATNIASIIWLKASEEHKYRLNSVGKLTIRPQIKIKNTGRRGNTNESTK